MNLWVPAGLVVGLLVGWAGWVAFSPIWASPVLRRKNFRDRELPVAGGLVLIAAAIAGGAVMTMARLAGSTGETGNADVAMVLAVVGFGLLGFVDDVLGGVGIRGLKGHIREATKGRVTTGALKLAGGVGLAVVCVGLGGPQPAWRFLVDVVLVAAAANLVNLFDLAPGRAIKWSSLAFVALIIAFGSSAELFVISVVIGAAWALLVPDLRERVMLGDTGANPLGAVLGLAVVIEGSPTARLAVMAAVVVLNLVSERVSFSRIIGRVPPLRALDRLGRLA